MAVGERDSIVSTANPTVDLVSYACVGKSLAAALAQQGSNSRMTTVLFSGNARVSQVVFFPTYGCR